MDGLNVWRIFRAGRFVKEAKDPSFKVYGSWHDKKATYLHEIHWGNCLAIAGDLLISYTGQYGENDNWSNE